MVDRREESRRDLRAQRFLFFLAISATAFLSGCAAIDPDGAPPSSSAQYTPPSTATYQQALTQTKTGDANGISIPSPGQSASPDLTKPYRLTDLVNLAERTNPETRSAWESCQQAAIAVGIREAAYYPIISLLAKGGQADLDTKTNNPALKEPDILADQAGAGLELSWLLFDFGAREEDVAAAKHELVATTMAFNETHQKVIIDVIRNYYSFCTARGSLEVARADVQSANAVLNATGERLEHGTATSPDALLAKERAVQTSYDLIQASADVDIARANLCEAMGLPPTTNLNIVDVSDAPLPTHLDETVEEATRQALVQRPDLIADMAAIQAKDAELREARDELLPQISLKARANQTYATATAYPLPVNNARITITDYAVLLQVEWTLFNGFSNINKIRLAESEEKQAKSQLEQGRVQVEGEIFEAYTKLKTSLRKLDVSKLLVQTSQESYQASLAGYKQGLQTILDTLAAQRDLRAAQENEISTRAEVFTNWENLAFSIGNIKAP